MILLIVLSFVLSSIADDNLKQILKSPKATLQLYRNFKTSEGLQYSGKEDRLRFRLFRENAAFVANLNSHEDSATYGLNFFSSLTIDERKRYLGLNVTGHLSNDKVMIHQTSASLKIPRSKLWTNVAAVTEVKNQGACGSCWSFGAVGGLETRYQQESGKLRNFAEQEYLDCVYEGKKDGCQGGWPEDAFSYSQRNGGRLASSASYTYTQRDGRCLASSTPDAMVALKIAGYVKVGASERANIEALATGSVSVAFEVTDRFQQYTRGIMRDTTCWGYVNHAVTAVGYTWSFILAKNSWGGEWGDKGFVKFSRNFGNCRLFEYSSYPKLIKTGMSDRTPNDPATPYRAYSEDEPEPQPECKDLHHGCNSYARYCQKYDWARQRCPKTCKICKDKPEPSCKDELKHCAAFNYFCSSEDWAKKNCAKTCEFCGNDEKDDENSEKCPAGTIRCSDGICRHEHMCH